MNVSRLAEFSNKIVAIETELNIGKRLGRVAGKLGELVGAPANPQFQTELVALIGEMAKQVEVAEARMTPAMWEFLDLLQGRLFFSRAMVQSIDGEIRRNGITHAVAKAHVDDIANRRTKFIEALKGLATNMSALGLKPEELQPGQAEIGFQIPRDLFGNRLVGFSAELKVIERIVEVFSEAVTGHREEAKLAELSTSDPLVLLQLYAPVVVAIGASVTWFLATYKQALEIRQIKAQLKKFDIEDTSPLDKKIQKIVDDAIEARVEQVLAQRDDTGRMNEVANGLRFALKDLWSRVERGMKVEIRVLPPAQSEQPTDEQRRDAAVYEELRRIQQELVFPVLEGEPMLRLTSGAANENKGAEAKPAKRKRGRPRKKDESGAHVARNDGQRDGASEPNA